MGQSRINVKYNFSKHKGDFSENTLEVHVNYRIAETLTSSDIRYDTNYRSKLLKRLTQHIATYEALNNHIASSVEIISID